MSEEAGKLAAYNKKATLSSREIQTAVRLIFRANWRNTPSARARKPVSADQFDRKPTDPDR